MTFTPPERVPGKSPGHLSFIWDVETGYKGDPITVLANQTVFGGLKIINTDEIKRSLSLHGYNEKQIDQLYRMLCNVIRGLSENPGRGLGQADLSGD